MGQIIDIHINDNKSDLIVSSFFLVVNFIIHFILIYFYGINLKITLNLKLILIIFFDFLLRLINILFISSIYILLKEVVLSLLVTCEFFLILSFLKQLLSDKRIKIDTSYLTIENNYLSSFVFFGFIFVYNTHDTKYIKITYGVNYIIVIGFILSLYNYIHKSTKLFINTIHISDKKYNYSVTEDIIINFPLLCTICFIAYYILRFIVLFMENKDNIKFLEMICILPKEVGKYLLFTFLCILYYIFDNFISKGNNSKTNTGDFDKVIHVIQNDEDIDNDKQELN